MFQERAEAGYREGAREGVAPPRWDLPAPILAWWVLFDARAVNGYRAGGAGGVARAVGPEHLVRARRRSCWRAGVLGVLVVRSIDARQRERCRRLEATSSPRVRTLERSERAD